MIRKVLVAVTLLTAIVVRPVQSQSRVGKDSATRVTRFGRDLVYGTAEGLAFAVVDQVTNSPEEWGKGWPGYEKRAASNVGEFLIQETVTEGLAAAMNRPLDYTPCKCRRTANRIEWAIKGSFTDQMPNGTHPLAIPRMVGAFVGSFAQSSWRPDTKSGRTRVVLVNGVSSIVVGAGINLYHEFRHDVTRALRQ
jgi:hypothetical protein